MITGVTLSVGSVNRNASGGVLVAIRNIDQNGLPGSLLQETLVQYNAIADTTAYAEFYPYVKIRGSFFVTYTLTYSAGDAFAVKQASWRGANNNTAYLKLTSGWAPVTQVSPQ